MRLSLAIKSLREDELRTAVQIGVEDLVYYNMQGMPATAEKLGDVCRFAGKCGMRVSVVEGGPPMGDIVLGKEGRDAQIEGFKRCLDAMGKNGIGVLCYNFMPQVMKDAMVVRTSYDVPERGGARTSAFDAGAFDPDSIAHGESPTTDEQMWDNLEYFLRRVVPAAEAAEVKLAMHPDDPPFSPMCGLARIMRSVENFKRLAALVPSQVNGITFCAGCFGEMGVDVPEAFMELTDSVHFVHLRDISGTPESFRETFPDNGDIGMHRLLATLERAGYQGYMRPDHVPQLAVEAGRNDGYGFIGHLYAAGYYQGVMAALCAAMTKSE